MSRTIDERVVEMRFDNAQFERNVQTSMSTLDKLKQKLNFKGASDGLDKLNTAARRTDLSALGKSVETVTAKFSAFQVMGMTALANITNSAVNAGKRILSALTIDPVKDGLTEYETQINAVQTILANTQKEGTNVKQVNAALDELNHYADKTIYNFTEMTRNIGTFTAAGVKLDTSVNAIQGIANLAAVSGSTSQQASTAMYQLSQALASGTVKLMDWNSVVNAGMGGQLFQDALTETSEKLQTGAKAAIEAKGSFRESLQTGWLTAEVLTETLKKFTTSGATEYVAEYTGLSKEAVEATLKETDAWGDNADAIDKAAEALAKKSGKSAEEIKNTLQFAKTAEDAATKVKTFSQLIDTLKEALGSGWTETWRLIIGDFEEAKEVWTSVSDVLGGFINNMSDARNAVLESALGKGFGSLSRRMMKFAEPIGSVADTIDKTVDAVSNLDDIVNNVIRGDFGNGQDRIDALTAAGENYYRIQNKVNEALGCAYRYTEEQISAQDELLGKTSAGTASTSEESEATSELTEKKKELIKEIAHMSEEEMHQKGLTEAQIAAFKKLTETADKLGMPIDDFIDQMDQINGRWLLLNSFKNIGESLINVFSAIKNAWSATFNPVTADTIFNIIAAFHKFTSIIKDFTENNADNLTRTFRGLFAALDIVRSVVGGGLSFAFKAINAILKAFDTNILEVTANIGDAIVAFRDFLFNNNLITKGFELFGQGVKMVVDWLGELLKKIENIPKVKDFLDGFGDFNLAEAVSQGLESLKNIDLAEVGHNIIAGLKNGLSEGLTVIPSILAEIGTSLLDAIKGVLGIHSPSTEMYDIGKNTILGLWNGLKELATEVIAYISDFGAKLLDAAKDVDWDKVFKVGSVTAFALILYKISKVVENFSKPFESLGEVFESTHEFLDTAAKGIEKTLKSFSKVLKARAFEMKTEGIMKLAISLGILTAAVYALSRLDWTELVNGGVAIAVLSGVLVGLEFAVDKLNKSSMSLNKKDGLNLKGFNTALIQIGMTILLIAAAVKLIGAMDPDQAKAGFLRLAAIVGAIAVVFAAFGKFVKGESAENIDKAGKMIKKMAVSLLLIAAVAKIVGTLSPDDMGKGAAFLSAFIVFVALLSKITRHTGEGVNKLGGMMIKMAVAMGLMVGVVKLVGKLSATEMLKGAAFAAAFVIFVKALRKAVSTDNDTQIAKIGGLLLSISFSMTLMVGVVKLVGKLSASDMLKGAAFAAAFVIFVNALVKSVKMDSESKIAKVGGLLLSVSIALGVMVRVCKLAGTLSTGDLLKGGVAIAAFGAIMVALIKAVKNIGPDAAKMSSTLLAMSIAIGIMAGVCTLLSMLSIPSLAKGIVAVGMLAVMMTAMIWATRDASDCMKNLIVMTSAIAIMAGAVALLSLLDQNKLIGATACLSALMGMFALMTKASSAAGGSIKSIAVMTVVVGALSGVLYVLANLPLKSSAASAASLSVLLLSMSAAMKIMSKIKSVSKGAIVSVGVMTIVIGALAGILYLIRDLPVESTLGNVVALSTLLIALSTSTLILSKVGPMASSSVTGAAELMLVLGAVAVIFAAVGDLIGMIPGAQEFLDSGIVVLEKLGYGLGAFFGNIIGGFTAGATAGLPEIAENLKKFMETFSEIDTSAVSGVEALTNVILEISGASVLSGISKFLNFGKDPMEQFSEQVVIFGGALNALAKTVSGLSDTDVSNIATITQLGTGLAQLQSLVQPVSLLGAAITGVKDLGIFGAQVSTYATNLNMAADAVKDISADGLTNLGKIAEIGQAFTELQKTVSPAYGFMQVLEGEKDLGDFGGQVSTYATNLNTAANAVKEISADGLTNLETIATLGEAFTKLQSTVEPAYGFMQVLEGEKNLGDFGAQVSTYATKLNTAADAVKDISADGINNLETITTLGEAFTKLQSTVEPAHGLAQALAGKTDLGTFGKDISTYASGISEASKSLTGENAIDSDAITAAVKAGSLIAALQKALPEESWFDGKMNLSDFKKRITDFGTAMGSFGDSVKEMSPSKVSAAIAMGEKIASFAASLADMDTDGIKKFADGGSGKSGWGVPDVGDAISKFSDSVSDVDNGAVSKSITSATRLKTFVDSLSGFTSDGIENFQVSDIGKEMQAYSDAVSGISTSKVTASITGAKNIVKMVKDLSNIDASGVVKFKSVITQLGTIDLSGIIKTFGSASSKLSSAGADMIKSLVEGMSSSKDSVSETATTIMNDALENFKSKGLDFTDAGTTAINSLNEGMSNKKDTVSALAESIISDVLEKFTSKYQTFTAVGSTLVSNIGSGMSSRNSMVSGIAGAIANIALNAFTSKYSSFMTAGANLIAGLANGMSSRNGSVSSVAVAIGYAGANGVRGSWSSFYQAGGYLGDGLVLGIQSRRTAVYNAAYELGQKAVQGEKDGQKSKSPSKLTEQAGKWLGEGLVIGINSMSTKVYEAGNKMGNDASKAILSVASDIPELFKDGMVSTPTIRPVVDLSNVKAGIGDIGAMFTNSIMSTSATVNSVGASMSRKPQNTETEELTSAIKKLNKDLGRVGNTYTTIDSITYDDGSEIAEAVSTLIRAARIERRR